MRKFSAKRLLTFSARQLCYLDRNPYKDKGIEITEQILDGQRFQEQVINELGRNGHLDEMGGVYTTKNGDLVYFSHDIVSKDGLAIYETKRLPQGQELSQTYFQKSVLQCALYDTLTRFSSPNLVKSNFARDGMNDNDKVTLRKEYNYYLRMGEYLFLVTLLNPHPILNYVNEKTKAMRFYDDATDFDDKWKGHEYELLNHCFSVEQLQ